MMGADGVVEPHGASEHGGWLLQGDNFKIA